MSSASKNLSKKNDKPFKFVLFSPCTSIWFHTFMKSMPDHINRYVYCVTVDVYCGNKYRMDVWDISKFLLKENCELEYRESRMTHQLVWFPSLQCVPETGVECMSKTSMYSPAECLSCKMPRSTEILMFASLQKDAEQCCEDTKLDRTKRSSDRHNRAL